MAHSLDTDNQRRIKKLISKPKTRVSNKNVPSSINGIIKMPLFSVRRFDLSIDDGIIFTKLNTEYYRNLPIKTSKAS